MAAVTALEVNQTGDRSFSASFTSAAAADTLAVSALTAPLSTSSIKSFLSDDADTLAGWRDAGASFSVVTNPSVTPVASVPYFDGSNFAGFAAGNHVLRVELPYSASA